jgi:hypothetical protein
MPTIQKKPQKPSVESDQEESISFLRFLWELPVLLVVFVMVGLMVLLFWLPIVWPLVILNYWPYIQKVCANPLGRLIGTVIVLLVVFGLYLLKREMRILYALGEILVGMLAIYASLGTKEEDVFKIVAIFAAGIYCLVKGFEHCAAGLNASEKKPKRRLKAESEC